MPATVYPLKLGSITFDQGMFEGPNGDGEGLSDFGSKQKSVVHEYAGGIVTAQLFGSFPKRITWTGKLFGAYAQARSDQIQKLVDDGQQITFTWANLSFDGFAEEYTPSAHGPNEIYYKIEFRPVVNNNTVTGGNAPANNSPFDPTVSNAVSPLTASGLSQQTAPFTTTPPATAPFTVSDPANTVAPAVVTGSNSLSNSISSALQGAAGVVANIPTGTAAALVSQISALQALLSPIINGNFPISASAAADLNGTLGILNTAFSTPNISPMITTIQRVNPNVYQLAAQYYGSPLLYQVILDANPVLGNDPLPETNGSVSISIPVLPPQAAALSTIMTDALAA